MQDSRQRSRGCWCERSLQVRSGGSSSQYAPDRPSSAWWNDKQNDIAELVSRIVDPLLFSGGAQPSDQEIHRHEFEANQ